jgi:hypothetical protein
MAEIFSIGKYIVRDKLHHVESEVLEWNLNMQVTVAPDAICINQHQYILNQLKEFDQYIGECGASTHETRYLY